MLTIDNLSASSAASLALDEATNCTIAFGRFVYFLSCLAYAAGQEFRSYCDNELIAQIELAIGIVQWLIHWLETADDTAHSLYALPPVSDAPTASVAITVRTLAEPLAEPTTSVRDEAVADTPETTKPTASTTGKRRTTTSKSKAQTKSTTSSRSKTKRSTT
ncbi:hypothetical protein [Merismopedia glauca]